MKRHRFACDEDAGVSRRADAGVDEVDVGEVGEPVGYPTRIEKAPIEDFEGLEKTAMEVKPALADEGVVGVLREGKLREDREEELVGEEGGGIGCRRVQGRKGEVGFGERRGR